MKHLTRKYFSLLGDLADSFFPLGTNPVSAYTLCILRTHQQIASTLHPNFKNRGEQGLTNLNV